MHAVDKSQRFIANYLTLWDKTFFARKFHHLALNNIIILKLNMSSQLIQLQQLEGHDDRVWHLAWSPNGRLILIILILC